MKWKKISPTKHRGLAPNGQYTIERRAGHWMVFTPEDDTAVYVSPHMGYGHMDVDYMPDAKAVAESHTRQRRTGRS